MKKKNLVECLMVIFVMSAFLINCPEVSAKIKTVPIKKDGSGAKEFSARKQPVDYNPHKSKELPLNVFAGNISASSKISVLKKKLNILNGLIKKSEDMNIDMSRQIVSATVGKKFIQFIQVDVTHGEGYYAAKKMTDFRILGKDEALRRIRGLVDFEIKETEKILDRAIAETKQMIKKPSGQIRFPPRIVKKVHIKNGALYSGNKPVFLSGLRFSSPTNEVLDDMKNLGGNLVCPANIVCKWDWQEKNKFNEVYKERVLAKIKAAEKKGFYVSPLLDIYHAPKWILKIAPDLDVKSRAFCDVSQAKKHKTKGWFRSCMDLDHPRAEEVYRQWTKRVASSYLKDLPNILSYSLMGEEWCKPSFRSKYTRPRYEKWLKKKHGNIENLNKAWRTQYKTFYDATDIASVSNKGGHYDWNTFNQYRLTTLNQWQIDSIKQVDPKGYASAWPGAGCLLNSPLGGRDSRSGRNREDIIRQSVGVVSWDGGIFPFEIGVSRIHLPKSHWVKYNMGWRDEMIYYDFSKSLCPEKVIFDPELHTIAAWHYLLPLGFSADFFRTTLWLEHLHGLAAHSLWGYSNREVDGTPKTIEFIGNLITQPQLMESWGRTVLELRRLAEYIVLFPQLQRKVKILYSEPSGIQDNKKYPWRLMSIYEALYFLDYQIGFTTEKTIMKQGLKNCALLIIPDARYVNKRVVAKIRQYRKKGGKIAILGQDSLKYDEYGNARDISDFLKDKSLYLKGSTPEEYSPQLDTLMDQVGIERPIRILDDKGNNAWGVEMRVVEKAEKRIFYLINLNKQDVKITLKMKNPPNKAVDLINRKKIDISAPFVIPPRKPMLIRY
jgi:Beta-galactosidase